MAYRYTDTATRLVYSTVRGTVGQAGKIVQFWTNSAGTAPVEIGLYSEAAPSTPGASTGSNQLTVQADSMWPAMWDRVGTLDHMWIQAGTADNPGELYKVYADADQRLDSIETRATALEAGATTEAATRAAADLLRSGLELEYAESTAASSTTVSGGTWFDVPGLDITVTPGDRPVIVKGAVSVLEAQFDGITQTRLQNVTAGTTLQASNVAFSSAVRRPSQPGVLQGRLLAGTVATRLKLQVTILSGSGTLRINSDNLGVAVGANWLQAVEV